VKKLIKCLMILPLFLLMGCGTKTSEEVVKDLESKVEETKSYIMEGEMDVVSGANTFSYDVEISYVNDEFYKVSLTNKNTNQIQIILKNADGVYVLTPALNKSFKFESDWPYNNSQAYLFQSVVRDIVNDGEREMIEEEGKYIFKTKANYINNNKITSQVITMTKDLKLESVVVYDEDENEVIIVRYSKVDFDTKFADDYFMLEQNMTVARANLDDSMPVYSGELETLYPIYLPMNTSLKKESLIDDESGQRVILEFVGESSFTLVQQKVTPSDSFSIITLYGEPALLSSGVGFLTDNSITWMVNDIEMYVVSSDLSEEELYNIAESVGVFQFAK